MPPPPGQPAMMMAGPVIPSAPPANRRLAWPGVLALVLVLLLTLGLGIQSWLLYSVSADLDEANQRLEDLGQGQAYGDERLDALEDRAGALEDFAGDVFDPEEVANAALPSVLMVVAGDFGGTAFAVGEETAEGGTNLFTNFHVVQQVWDSGGRAVELQRTNQVYPAEIVDVAPEADVAWLRTSSSFRGLATSTDVTSGEQIIVVGAPQGLNDTVTTGVVSTPERMLDDGSGPWIQFDAAINPGNSGGPVIDSDQAVIGIASAKDPESEAIGYAVPINVACGLFEVC
jgi:putative serine protease PepD